MNFFDTYNTYSHDNFCPDIFHEWTAYSIVAGALERRVWYKYNGGKNRAYPPLYIFLIGRPGCGKTTAASRGVELLKKVPSIKFGSQQATEAAFIEQMEQMKKTFEYKGNSYSYNSCYFFGPEASNTFKEVHGDLKPLLTDWYDCGENWSKQKSKEKLSLDFEWYQKILEVHE